MNKARFNEIFTRYRKLRVAVVGDFCLDRYLEIDSSKNERSIETGLAVHNVIHIRSQPGGAGTILNNLVSLGVGKIFPIGFSGDDGEGFELCRALSAKAGVRMNFFISSKQRRTFTYTKPLLMAEGKLPKELNRLDVKNWTATPSQLQEQLARNVRAVSKQADAVILMDQVDIAETGVVTKKVLKTMEALKRANPKLLIVADSRRTLKSFPPVIMKMNTAELGRLTGIRVSSASRIDLPKIESAAARLAADRRQIVFVTLAEYGILAASPEGQVDHCPALPTRGPIDIVGAGDAVTANLTAALAAGGTVHEAVAIANAAASIVIHQLGTTGTASAKQIGQLLQE